MCCLLKFNQQNITYKYVPQGTRLFYAYDIGFKKEFYIQNPCYAKLYLLSWNTKTFIAC